MSLIFISLLHWLYFYSPFELSMYIITVGNKSFQACLITSTNVFTLLALNSLQWVPIFSGRLTCIHKLRLESATLLVVCILKRSPISTEKTFLALYTWNYELTSRNFFQIFSKCFLKDFSPSLSLSFRLRPLKSGT